MPFGTEVKLGLVLAILTALIAFWQWDRMQAFDHGYAERVAEEKEENDRRIEESNEKVSEAQRIAKEEIDKAFIDAQHWKDVAIELQQQKPKVVYVNEIGKNNPDCTRLIGSSKLWNDIREQYK